MKLTKLQTLAENQSSSLDSVNTFFNRLDHLVNSAYDAIKTIRDKLQSPELTDMVKTLGHPASESRMAKEDVESAWRAIRKVENEIYDLHRALAMSAEQQEMKP